MADRTVKVTLIANATGYVAGMETAARKTRDVGSEAEKLAQKRQAFDQLGRAAVGFGVAVGAAVGLAVKAAIGWETAWTGVLKTVDGTSEELATLQGELRGLARELPSAHSEIAGVAEAAGQLGIKTENVAAFTKVMIDLGETTNLSANEAATAIARFTNVMGTSQAQVSNIGSAIVDLGNNYATTEAEIVEFAQRLVGAGKVVGFTEGDVLGLSAALSSVGVNAEAGGTAISKVMINISSAVENGGKKLDQFASVAGMSATDFAKAWRDDPGKALTAFITGLSNAESAGKSTITVLQDLGITEQRMRDALLLSSAAADQFADAMETGNRAFAENTALLTEAEKRYATTESQLRILGNQVNDAAISFGAVFLPAINDAAKAMGGLAGFLGGLPEPVQGVVGTVALLTAAVTVFGGAALLAVPKIAQMKLAMDALGMSGKDLALTFGKGGLVALALGVVVNGLSNLAKEAHLTSDQVSKLNAALQVGDLKAFEKELRLGGVATDLAGALEQVAGSGFNSFVYDATKAVIGFIPFAEGLRDEWTRNEGALNLFGESIADLAATDFPAAVEQFRKMQQAAGGTDETTRQLLETTPAYRDALRKLAAEQGIVLSEQDLLNLAMGEGEVATRLMREAAKRTAPTLSDIADAAGEARGEVEGLSDELRDFGKMTYTVIEAELRFREAIDDAVAALGADGFVPTLDRGTAAGRANWEVLLDIGQATLDFAAATDDAGGSVEEINGILADGWQRLYDQAILFGATETAAKEYADQLIATPQVVSTRVEFNSSAAEQKIKNLRGLLGQIPQQFSIGVGYSISGTSPFTRGYALGGYTGPGAKDQVAGVVHRDEFVSTSETLAKPANREALEYMHAGGDISRWAAWQPAPTAYAQAGSSSGPVDLSTRTVRTLVEAFMSQRVLEADGQILARTTATATARAASLGSS